MTCTMRWKARLTLLARRAIMPNTPRLQSVRDRMAQSLTHRVVLVAVDAALEPEVRAALARRSADVAASCPDVAAARAEAFSSPAAQHLFVAQLDAAHLAALTAALPGQPVVVLL